MALEKVSWCTFCQYAQLSTDGMMRLGNLGRFAVMGRFTAYGHDVYWFQLQVRLPLIEASMQAHLKLSQH